MVHTQTLPPLSTPQPHLCNIAKGLVTTVNGGRGLKSAANTKFWKLVLIGSLPDAVLFWKSSSGICPLLSLIFGMGMTLHSHSVRHSCGFLACWQSLNTGCSGLLVRQVESVAFEFFSPNVDVTLATTQSPLHWDEWKPPSCLRGVRWEFMTSGILLSTQAFLALQHSIVRGQDRLSLYGQESCHCPKYLRGSGSFWCGQKLLLCLELPRI